MWGLLYTATLLIRVKCDVLEQTDGVSNFVWISLFCCPLEAKKKQILPFFGLLAYCGVASWQQSEKVEHRCTTTNLPLFNGIKIVSVLQRLHGKIGHTISGVQKHDGKTDKKLNVFGHCRAKSEPHQTWHGDRGPRARSCTSKTFGVRRIALPLGGAENLGETHPSNLKIPVTL